MKFSHKIILFLIIVFLFVVVLFFWWRSLGGKRAPATPGGGNAASSSFDFPEIPRAEVPPLFEDDPKDTSKEDAAFYASFPPVVDTYTGPVDSHGEPILSSEAEVFSELTLSRLSDTPAFSHWAVGGTGEVFYFTETGKVFTAEEGDDLEVSSQELPSPLRRALPSLDGRLVLGLFGTIENPRWGIYDTIDTVWRPLPAGARDAVWGMTNETLLLRVEQGSSLALGTINLRDNALTFTPLIQDFRLKHVSMHMVSPERVLFAEDPLPGAQSRLWELNIKTLGLRLLSGAEEGLLLSASPKRDFILKYASPDVFQVLDAHLEEQAPVFFVTLPQKCGFDNENIFCFRPQEDVAERAAFFDDYLKKRIFTTDSFVAFGPNDLGEDTLFVSGGADAPVIDGIHPMFAKGKYTFINRYDGYVYQLAR